MTTEHDLDTLTAIEADAFARGLLRAARGKPRLMEEDHEPLDLEEYMELAS